MARIDRFIEECPIIAILRGVTPKDVVAVGESLYRAGIRIIEVPLNSPRPLVSIELLRNFFGTACVIGAGTVLDAEHVDRVIEAGGEVIVAPNVDAQVLQQVNRIPGAIAIPGIFTATEALQATSLRARYLKLFPASSVPAHHVSALQAVLPAGTKIIAVGGIGGSGYKEWLDAGVSGFGVGSQLYNPGASHKDVYLNASRIVTCIREHSQRKKESAAWE